MKRILVLTAALVLSFSAFSQSDIPYAPQSVSEPQEGAVYKLFSTHNIWTFLKLDTRNGRIWQVQFSVEKIDESFELPLSSTYLVTTSEEKNGRFTLYPTSNIYNFILLDQISGNMWQVQWSTKIENRGIIPIR